jgi:hypothetical protein
MDPSLGPSQGLRAGPPEDPLTAPVTAPPRAPISVSPLQASSAVPEVRRRYNEDNTSSLQQPPPKVRSVQAETLTGQAAPRASAQVQGQPMVTQAGPSRLCGSITQKQSFGSMS